MIQSSETVNLNLVSRKQVRYLDCVFVKRSEIIISMKVIISKCIKCPLLLSLAIYGHIIHCEFITQIVWSSLRWRRNGHDGVANHQPHHCLLNRLFGCRSKKASKLRVTGLCVGNSPGTGEFPAQMVSNAENVSIWWRHHVPPGTYIRQVESNESASVAGFMVYWSRIGSLSTQNLGHKSSFSPISSVY